MLLVSCSGWQGHAAVHQESHRCSLLLQPGLVYWEPHPWPRYVCQEWCRVSSLTMQHYCLNFSHRSNKLKCYKNVIFQFICSTCFWHSAHVKSKYFLLLKYLNALVKGFTWLGWCDYFIIYLYLNNKVW